MNAYLQEAECVPEQQWFYRSSQVGLNIPIRFDSCDSGHDVDSKNGQSVHYLLLQRLLRCSQCSWRRRRWRFVGWRIVRVVRRARQLSVRAVLELVLLSFLLFVKSWNTVWQRAFWHGWRLDSFVRDLPCRTVRMPDVVPSQIAS